MRKGNILVIDDEKLIRWSLKESLEDEGYSVVTAGDGKSALSAAGEDTFDLALLDYQLPDINGLEVLVELHKDHPELPVVMVTSHSTIDHAVTAIRSGASDYVSKPFRGEDLLYRIERVLETSRLKSELHGLRAEQRQRFGFDKVIGKSPAMEKVFKLIDRVMPLGEGTILIQGESGTGKDVLAKAIHYGGPRAEGAYVNITCTALPETLLESELFGHEKGSFTDAKAQKKGLVELADGGTLFLDEIGDMSLYLQAKLLRFLEEKTFRRVGGNEDIRVTLRVVAATNRDLNRLVDEGRFREDLYFRLKVIPIDLPPLREREGDIPLLVQHFVDEFNREFNKNIKGFAPSIMKRLEEYAWPGNIRELRNTVERGMILGREEILTAEDLPLALFDEPREGRGEPGSIVTLTRKGLNIEELEKDLVCQALQLTHGNQTRAGRLLGLNRDQIRYRIEKFDLKVPSDDA